MYTVHVMDLTYLVHLSVSSRSLPHQFGAQPLSPSKSIHPVVHEQFAHEPPPAHTYNLQDLLYSHTNTSQVLKHTGPLLGLLCQALARRVGRNIEH